jgi:hypothetical protein
MIPFDSSIWGTATIVASEQDFESLTRRYEETDAKLKKVQAAIQGEQVRVSGPYADSNPFFDHPILNSPYECPHRHWLRRDSVAVSQATLVFDMVHPKPLHPFPSP